MIVWFIEIPFIFIVIAAIALFVMGSMLVELAAHSLVAVGVVLMSLAIPVLIVSAALQHVSAEMVAKCDKIMKFLCINGGILFVTGFTILCTFGMSLV